MATAAAGRPAADVAAALAADLRPAPDLYSSAETKLHLARVLTGRALASLAA
jgi:CO/xanthine dehydrogenase FAD-binding subunit